MVNDSDKYNRRVEQIVVDKGTERGIKLNNILTGIVIVVISWVGVEIRSMGEKIEEATIAVAVNSSRITANTSRIVSLEHTVNRRLFFFDDSLKKGPEK